MPQKSHNANNNKIKKNRKDVFGRDISYLLSCIPTLSNLKDIDVYSHDYESGYTPLHIMLRDIHIQKAFKVYKLWKDEKEFYSHKLGGNVFNQLDNDGFTPFELYNLELSRHNSGNFPNCIFYEYDNNKNRLLPKIMYHDKNDKDLLSWNIKLNFMSLPISMEDRQDIWKSEGLHLLTFGSNVNYQLGTGNKDDRKQLFQIDISRLGVNNYDDYTPINDFMKSNVSFNSILMKRYFSIVSTSDNKVFTCGNSSRGRLGNGLTDIPESKYREVLDLGSTGIKQISASDHHTLILDEDGSLYSWGWNSYGQLGYNSGKISKDDSIKNIFSDSSKKVSILDNKYIKLISCSNIHSCAVTNNNVIYLWGLNVGQLGTSKPTHLLPDAQHVNTDGFIVKNPVTVTIPNGEIEQVVCTDFSTLIRTSNNTLFVLSNYYTKSFKIPLPKSKHFNNKSLDHFTHFTPREISNKIIDMKCSNIYGNNVCFNYLCGRIGILSIKDESVNMWSKIKNRLPISLYWTPNYTFKRCLDFDVSSSGSLIICTLSGTVLTSQGLGKPFEKVFSHKLISGRAIKVSCDSTFGSFSILKAEANGVPIVYPKSDINLSFSEFSPLTSLKDATKTKINGPLLIPNIKLANKDVVPYSDKKSSSSQYHSFEAIDFSSESPLVNKEGHNDLKEYNIIFILDNEEICGCHKYLLNLRCKNVMRQLFEEMAFNSQDGSFTLELDCDPSEKVWKIKINLIKDWVSVKIFKQAIHFLYTDEKLDSTTWRLLLILLDNAMHMSKLSSFIKESFEYCQNSTIPTSINFLKPDTILYTSDGTLYGHSFILSARSSFFSSALNSTWMPFDKNGLRAIHLENIEGASKDVIGIILKYLYSYSLKEIIDELQFKENAQYVNFYLDVLRMTDFFNLEYFKNMIEGVVDRLINGKNVIPIFINSIHSNAALLATKCSFFIANNIGIIFSSKNIEVIDTYMDDYTWSILENNIKTLKNQGNMNNAHLPWYKQVDTDWINLFKGNINAFNEKFVGKDSSFASINFEKRDPNQKNNNSRKFSNLKMPRASFNSTSSNYLTENETVEQSVDESIESTSFWQSQYNFQENDYAIADEEVDFTEVIKKQRRKYSEKLSPKDEVPILVYMNKNQPEIHIHSAAQRDNLPSLLNTDFHSSIADRKHSETKTTPSSSFRKLTQKERIKQLQDAEEELKRKQLDEEKKKSQPVWGSQVPSNSSVKRPSITSHKQKSLPSLYDDGINSNDAKTHGEPIRLSAATIVARNIPLTVRKPLTPRKPSVNNNNVVEKKTTDSETVEAGLKPTDTVSTIKTSKTDIIKVKPNTKKKKPNNKPKTNITDNSGNKKENKNTSNKKPKSESQNKNLKDKQVHSKDHHNTKKKNNNRKQPSTEKRNKKPLNGNIVQVHKKPLATKPQLTEAEEFERWFQEESARVQQQMNNQTPEDMDTFYNNGAIRHQLPDFITQEETKEKAKKSKTKFSRKNQTAFSEQDFFS